MCRAEENEAVMRVRQMEQCFDALLADWHAEPPRVDGAQLKRLLEYYEGGQWLRDYELDEQGGLPPDLKRGVLSEDGVYNFLAELFSPEEPTAEELHGAENGSGEFSENQN